VWIFETQHAIKWPFGFPPHPASALALPGENRPSKSCVEMNEKTKFYLSRSLAPNSQLITKFDCHAATYLYLMTFRNVYESWFLRSGGVMKSQEKITKSDKGIFTFQSQGKMRWSGKVRENQSTRVQKLTKMQKKVWTVLCRLHRLTTAQNFFLLASLADYLYLHF